jgi:succinyl-CoA synthetase alpha subunit
MHAQIKMIVILGELGGRDEYGVVEAIKAGAITKPVVAWVAGPCAALFKSEVGAGGWVGEAVLCGRGVGSGGWGGGVE